MKADFAPVDIRGSVSLDSSGFVGGIQAGYDYQFPNRLVLGVEADVNASGVEGKVNVSGAAAGVINGNLSLNAGSELNSLSTLRGRLGYAFDNGAMPYATAGIAYGEVDTGYGINVSSGGTTLFSASGSKSADRTGWTAGAGLEYRLNDKFSFKTEYLYTDLGSYNVLKFNGMGGTASLDADTTIHTVRVGVNYHFN